MKKAISLKNGQRGEGGYRRKKKRSLRGKGEDEWGLLAVPIRFLFRFLSNYPSLSTGLTVEAAQSAPVPKRTG